MMPFTLRTFSTDWEHFVLDGLDRCVDTRHLMGFAGQLRSELNLPIDIDKSSLEFPLGVNHSFAQLWERIQRATDRAAALLADYRLHLYPAGAHPVDRHFNSAHIHVGTLADEAAGFHLANALLPYVPAIAALAANAPAWHGQRGEYKSYRIRHNANGDIKPIIWRDPALAQRSWGDDAGPKLFHFPTLEVRAVDCASCRRLLAEMAVFVAAFVHALAKAPPAEPDPTIYRDAMINRWSAARHGLQATFRWPGGPRPAVDVLAEMRDRCTEELAALGAAPGDLDTIDAMLAKRLCQADMTLALAARYPDPWLLANACAKRLRDWSWFPEFLQAAAPLDPLPAPDDEVVLQAHLAIIGEHTHLYRTRELMSLPPPAADAIVAELERRGQLHREMLPDRGIMLTRIEYP